MRNVTTQKEEETMTDLNIGDTVRVQNPNGGFKGVVTKIKGTVVHVLRGSIYVGGEASILLVHESRVTAAPTSGPIAWTGSRHPSAITL